MCTLQQSSATLYQKSDVSDVCFHSFVQHLVFMIGFNVHVLFLFGDVLP